VTHLIIGYKNYMFIKSPVYNVKQELKEFKNQKMQTIN